MGRTASAFGRSFFMRLAVAGLMTGTVAVVAVLLVEDLRLFPAVTFAGNGGKGGSGGKQTQEFHGRPL